MLEILKSVFSSNAYVELSHVVQILGMLLEKFDAAKMKGGESDRNAAIDAVCAFLQSEKT